MASSWGQGLPASVQQTQAAQQQQLQAEQLSAAGRQVTTTSDDILLNFVVQYYTALSKKPELLEQFYAEADSELVHTLGNKTTFMARGRKEIHEKLRANAAEYMGA